MVELKGIVKSLGFQELWKIRKDDIEICKVCEFRYMCIDGRIPKRGERDRFWRHSSSCNYDPLMGKWAHEI